MASKRKSRLDIAARFVIMTLVFLLLASCTNHYLTKQMLMEQVFPEATLHSKSMPLAIPTPGLVAVIPVRYNSNRLLKILCYNEKSQKVYVSVNQNTQLIITDKNGGTHKFYLDTVFLENNTLHGLRSRILGMERSVSLDEIDKIEIYTELSRETPAEQTDNEKTPNS